MLFRANKMKKISEKRTLVPEGANPLKDRLCLEVDPHGPKQRGGDYEGLPENRLYHFYSQEKQSVR
jgi:hypothetical protein